MGNKTIDKTIDLPEAGSDNGNGEENNSGDEPYVFDWKHDSQFTPTCFDFVIEILAVPHSL